MIKRTYFIGYVAEDCNNKKLKGAVLLTANTFFQKHHEVFNQIQDDLKKEHGYLSISITSFNKV